MTALLLSLAWMAVQAAGVGPPLPAAHRILGLPLVERNTHWCGPAALAAVMRYHGEQISAKGIADAIYLPGFRGSLNLDLLVFARKQGYDVWAGEGSPKGLQEAIARDRPAICMVTQRNPLVSRNHIVVVRGYDTQEAVWFIDSGDGREETVGAAEFEAAWAKCGRWMLVLEGKKAGRAETPEGGETCRRQ